MVSGWVEVPLGKRHRFGLWRWDEGEDHKEMIASLLSKLSLRYRTFSQSGDFSKVLDKWVWISGQVWANDRDLTGINF